MLFLAIRDGIDSKGNLYASPSKRRHSISSMHGATLYATDTVRTESTVPTTNYRFSGVWKHRSSGSTRLNKPEGPMKTSTTVIDTPSIVAKQSLIYRHFS